MGRPSTAGPLARIALPAAVAAAVALSGCARQAPQPPSAVTVPLAAPSSQPSAALVPAAATSAAATSPATATVRVYFLDGERLVAVTRSVSASSTVSGALTALLAGPSSAEKRSGLRTAVPDGTRLRGVEIAGERATVDLTGRFESGGGTLSMSMRLAQLVYTLTEGTKVSNVSLRLDGRPVDVFGGEGLDLSEPLTRGSVQVPGS